MPTPNTHDARFMSLALALGRRGGKAAAGKAQAARWAGTTPEERRAIMRKVIEARWGKAKRRKT